MGNKASSRQGQAVWYEIPNEIWSEIFRYLDKKSVLQATEVCKRFKQVIRSDVTFSMFSSLTIKIEDLCQPVNYEDLTQIINGFPTISTLMLKSEKSEHLEFLKQIPKEIDFSQNVNLTRVSVYVCDEVDGLFGFPQGTIGYRFDPKVHSDPLTSKDTTELFLNVIGCFDKLVPFAQRNPMKNLRTLAISNLFYDKSPKTVRKFLKIVLNPRVRESLETVMIYTYTTNIMGFTLFQRLMNPGNIRHMSDISIKQEQIRVNEFEDDARFRSWFKIYYNGFSE